MENKNLNVKENAKVKEEVVVGINEETGEVLEENCRVDQIFECEILHRKGSSKTDSYYSFVFNLVTDDDFKLPITFQLLPDEVAIVNLSSDNFLNKIPVDTRRKVNLKGNFYIGMNEDSSAYVMALVVLPGDVYKKIVFSKNQNAFITKCIKMNKQLNLISIDKVNGQIMSVKNKLQYSTSKAKTADDLYALFD